ncbi:hypothetical protein VTI74DRAFT_6185 [Chaetomium olivicolor]
MATSSPLSNNPFMPSKAAKCSLYSSSPLHFISNLFQLRSPSLSRSPRSSDVPVILANGRSNNVLAARHCHLPSAPYFASGLYACRFHCLTLPLASTKCVVRSHHSHLRSHDRIRLHIPCPQQRRGCQRRTHTSDVSTLEPGHPYQKGRGFSLGNIPHQSVQRSCSAVDLGFLSDISKLTGALRYMARIYPLRPRRRRGCGPDLRDVVAWYDLDVNQEVSVG